MSDPIAATRAPSWGEALRFWLKLGFISFGGPAGQIAIMHRELVDEKRWVSEARFLHALNYCMLLPGPEAQQLATYLGWLMHRTLGGILASLLFVLPSLLILIGLSWVYVVYGQLPAVAGLLYGIKPAVAALVLQAVHRVGRRILKKPAQAPALWVVLAAALLVESTHGRLQFTAPLTAITAAVVGVIASLALLFIAHIAYPTGLGAGFLSGLDGVAVVLTALAALALMRMNWGVMPVIAACALAGLALRLAGLA